MRTLRDLALIALILFFSSLHVPAQTTFFLRELSPSSLQPTSVVPADIDRDGDNDVVAAEYTANAVVWYDNDGATPPGWTRRVIDVNAAGPITVAVGDVDRDGDLDVFSSNFNDEGVAAYRHAGLTSPTWTKQVISAFWVGAWGVDAADVDGDGDIDGIGGLTNTICGPPLDCRGVEWYDNDGANPPSFTIRPVSPGLLGASAVRAVDLDRDGDRDIVSVDTAGDRIVEFESDGGHPPVWTQRVVTTITNDPWAVAAADLDRGGDVDLISASAEDDRIAWLESDGGKPPSFTPHTLSTVRDGAISVDAADLDGDGDPDLIAGSWNDSTLVWYESDGGSPPGFVEHFISLCGGPEGIAAGRLDGDADFDVICASNPGNKILLFDNLTNYTDADGDGVRTGLDCAPASASAFAVPGEVRNLRFTSHSQMSWATEALRSGSSTVYDVLEDSLDALPVAPGSGGICLHDGTSATSAGGGPDPLPGTGTFLLVRGANACGVGTHGADSLGATRSSNICP